MLRLNWFAFALCFSRLHIAHILCMLQLAISVLTGSVQGQFNYSALFSQTFCTQLALPLPVSAAALPASHCCPCLWHTELGTALEKFFHFLAPSLAHSRSLAFPVFITSCWEKLAANFAGALMEL